MLALWVKKFQHKFHRTWTYPVLYFNDPKCNEKDIPSIALHMVPMLWRKQLKAGCQGKIKRQGHLLL